MPSRVQPQSMPVAAWNRQLTSICGPPLSLPLTPRLFSLASVRGQLILEPSMLNASQPSTSQCWLATCWTHFRQCSQSVLSTASPALARALKKPSTLPPGRLREGYIAMAAVRARLKRSSSVEPELQVVSTATMAKSLAVQRTRPSSESSGSP